MTTTTPVIQTRADLISALHEAAELEQGLMCQYLFAAFTLKKAGDPDSPYATPLTPAQYELTRRWQATIQKIGRQEMEHLALVNNLLLGIGDTPYFWRPNFPVKYPYDPFTLPFMLERFDTASLERFICFERPERWSPDDCGPDPDRLGVQAQTRYTDLAVPLRASNALPSYTPIDSIQELYDGISDAVNNVHHIPDLENLFVGDPQREPYKNFLFDQEANIFAFPVYDRRTANAAITEILREGEGVDAQPGYSSHYCGFSWIYQEHGVHRFDAAWNVIDNPSAENVTDPFTRGLLGLFDDAYTTMLYMITSFYTYFTPEGEQPPGPHGPISAALQDSAFAPMMTMVIRPISEILTRMPAGDGVHTAGPAWTIPDEDRALTPSSDPAFFLDRFTRMLATLQDLIDQAPADVRPRLTYIWQSIWRTRANFERTAAG